MGCWEVQDGEAVRMSVMGCLCSCAVICLSGNGSSVHHHGCCIPLFIPYPHPNIALLRGRYIERAEGQPVVCSPILIEWANQSRTQTCVHRRYTPYIWSGDFTLEKLTTRQECWRAQSDCRHALIGIPMTFTYDCHARITYQKWNDLVLLANSGVYGAQR